METKSHVNQLLHYYICLSIHDHHDNKKAIAVFMHLERLFWFQVLFMYQNNVQAHYSDDIFMTCQWIAYDKN